MTNNIKNCFIFWTLVVCFAPNVQAFWGDDVVPRLRVNYLSQTSDQVQSFLGNQTHKDYFKLLQTDGVSLLIGARNVVYNLSLADLTENVDRRITWDSMGRDRDLCIVKGKSEDECQNYVRVLAQPDSQTLLVCGTNSFKPKCRTYTTVREVLRTPNNTDGGPSTSNSKISTTTTTTVTNLTNPTTTTSTPELIDDGILRMKHEFTGRGICPLDPRHNSTAIYTGGDLYSGTVSDFSGTDALIYRNPLRTEQFDLKHLNAPDFVSSTEDEDYVYFFFREAAVEYINCGKAIYSRVARVCKNDRGGLHKFAHKWTTFLKARLNCSVPGDFPFYFNEIQGTTNFVQDGSKDKIIYATFTTPDNSLAGSAICSFKLSDIRKAFDEGHFKGQVSSDSNWLPIRDSELPSTRPGSCVEDSTSLPESHLNFIKRHSLMDDTVPSNGHGPIFVKTSMNERLTAIAVDPGVKTPGDDNADQYDVLYVGTTKGKVLKVISAKTKFGQHNRKPIIAEEIQVFPFHVAVNNIQVINDKLIVLSDHEVKALPLHRCSATQVQSCGACVKLRDPHCAWNIVSGACVDKNLFTNADASELIQDIFHGKHSACDASTRIATSGSGPTMEESNIVQHSIDLQDDDYDVSDNVILNDIPDDYPYMVEPRTSVTGESSTSALITASVVTAIAALIVGYLAGFLTAKKCSKDYKSCGHHYLEHHLNKTNESAVSLRNESGYTPTPCNNLNTNIVDHSKNNLLVNLPTKSDIEKNNINNTAGSSSSGSSATTTSSTVSILNGTLPRNGTLCKKVYL